MSASSCFIVNVEAFILDKDGRYLMIVRGESESHAPNSLSVPGGKVEASESLDNVLETTVRREVIEEVGVQLEDEMYYVESTLFTTSQGESVVDVVFLCRCASGELGDLSMDEVAEAKWMTAEEILSHPKLPDWTKRSFLQAEKKRKSMDW